MNDRLLAIARRLSFDTLETRNSDRLDFHEVAVWAVREALEAAFEAGKKTATEEELLTLDEPAPSYAVQRQDDGRYFDACLPPVVSPSE